MNPTAATHVEVAVAGDGDVAESSAAASNSIAII
jgi:hypothetical protein